MGLNVKTAAGNIRTGIYSSYNNSKFSGLLGQSVGVPVVSGWDDLALTGPVSITGGRTYYIVFVLSNNSCVYYSSTSGTQYKAGFTYGALPDPSGTLSTASKTANMRITYSTTSASTTSTTTNPTSTTSSSTTSTNSTSSTSTTSGSTSSTTLTTSSSTSSGSTSYLKTTDTIGSNASSVNQNNQLLGYVIKPSQSGNLTAVGLNVKKAAGNVRVGIYSSYNNSKFSGLLGQSVSVPVVSGWNDVALSAPISIVKGTTYYIVFVLSDNSCVYYSSTSGTQYKVALTYGSLPNPTGTLSTASKTANMRITYLTTQTTITSTTSTSTSSTSITWMSLACTYLISTDGTTTYMQNCKTGSILFSSTSAYLVFNKALGNLTTGGTLLTREGVYVISNTIYGRGLNNVTWRGDGWSTILQASANIVDTAASQCGGGNHIDVICIYGGTGWTVSDMQLDGNAPNQSGAGAAPAYLGIEAQYATHITFNHLYVHNFKTDGMQFSGTSDSTMTNNYVANNRADGIMETSWTPPYYAARNIIRGNTVTGSSDVGISVFGTDTLIEGNTIVNMTTDNSPFHGTVHVAILIGDDVNADRVTVRNNDIENNPLPGWAIQSSPSATATGNHDVTIDGNRIVNCAGGIDVIYTEGVTISNNVIQSTTSPEVPYGGIKVYTGATGISITGNLVNDSATYGILSQAGPATISGNTIIMTNRAASGQIGISLIADNSQISNNIVDLSTLTKAGTGILVSDGHNGNVVSGNTVTGNPSNLLGSGIMIGGTNIAVTNNQIGGFSVCINTSGTPNKGLIANNAISASQCTTKISTHGTSMIVTGNVGYNPIGQIASPFDNTLNTVKDGLGSATPKNATTMTVNCSPKVIKVVIGTGWTSTHMLVIKIDGAQVVSTTTPAANAVYTFTLNPGETFYVQYQSGKASFIVSGQ